MNHLFTIARREFKAYFISPIAYIYLTSFIVLTVWLFLRSFFLIGQANLRSFFGLMPWIYLFFVPAVSMGKWAEEKKSGTMELLLTYPIDRWHAVLGKFLGALGLVATALLFTSPLVITVAILGNLDGGPVMGGYLGLIFLSSAYLAIGLWVSSLTENQIIAFILGVVACFFFFIIGEPIVTAGAPTWVASLLQSLGLGNHFESMGRGVIDSRDVLFYLSVIGFFLFLNERQVEARMK